MRGAFIPAMILLSLLLRVTPLRCQDYNDTRAIFRDLLNPDLYLTEVRPINDQATPVKVTVDFELVSIVSFDDVTQTFVCNAAFTLVWTDERLRWDPALYGGEEEIHPLPSQFWRPRLLLMNTMGERDLFEDRVSPTLVHYSGTVVWVPGSLVSVACSLDLQRYPFDMQSCSLKMVSMGLPAKKLLFVAGVSRQSYYSLNGGWNLEDSKVKDAILAVAHTNFSVFEVTFDLTRRPTFFLLNIILPVVLLSVLNNFVFLIPVHSGEKIAYGMTVVLAMTVFLSIVSSMLPTSATSIPHVTMYLFTLLVVSAITLMASIVDNFLFHLEQKEDERRKVLSTVDDDDARIQDFKRKTRGTVYPLSMPTADWTFPNHDVTREGRIGISGRDSDPVGILRSRLDFRSCNFDSDSGLLNDPILNGESKNDRSIVEEGLTTEDALSRDEDIVVKKKRKPGKTEVKEKGTGRTGDEGINVYKFYRLKLEVGSAFVIVLTWLCATLWFFLSVTRPVN